VFSQCPTLEELRFYQQEDLDSFLINYPNCTEFGGDISITICINLIEDDQFGEYSIYDLSPLKNLISLGGISIQSNTHCWKNVPIVKELNSLDGLHNLTELGSFYLASGVPILSLSPLSKIKEMESLFLNHSSISRIPDNEFNIIINKSLYLKYNDKLSDISGISLSEDIENLEIFYNERLKEAPSLSGAKNIDDLELGHLDNISFLNTVEHINSLELNFLDFDPFAFQNLRSVGDIVMNEIGNISDLSFFSSVEFKGELLDLEDCSFTSLDGLDLQSNENLDIIKLNYLPLENLDLVGDAENVTELFFNGLNQIRNMPNLGRLRKLNRLWMEGMSNLESISAINVNDSLWQLKLSRLNLNSLVGLETLSSCESLDIQWLSNLENLEGLDNLNFLSNLSIFRNENLKNIDALINCRDFNLDSFNKNISIQSNDMLSSIDGISNWRGRWKQIIIRDNPNLSDCSIPPICDSYGTDTNFTIQNNGLSCNSDEEIKENCGYEYFMVFLDENQNGIKESTETGMSLGNVESNNGYTFYPNKNGLGDYNANGGVVTLEYIVPENWKLTTGSSTVIISLNQVDTIFFGLTPIKTVMDYDVFLSYNPIVCSSDYSAFLQIENEGTEIISGYVNLELPGDFLNISGAFAQQDSNQIKVEVEDILPGGISEVEIFMQSPSISEQTIDTLLDIEVKAGLSSLDNDSLFIEKNYSSNFLCAYDPNDKQVFPKGVDEEHYTLLENENFQYTIRFQNTGNFPATDVIIRDTLDEYLDPTTLKVRGTSHSELVTRSYGSAFEFRYENIFLPDSVNNEPDSHGYITFTVDRYPDVESYSEIKNKAHIYFDSNPPILTNTTSNIMVEDFSTSLDIIDLRFTSFNIWPVPVMATLNVYYPVKSADTWQIYNMSSSLIESGKVILSDFQVDVSKYPSGVYFIKIGDVCEKFIKY